MLSGISSIFCTDPFDAINLFFNESFHIPSFTKSLNKCLFTIINSPESTLLVYILEVYGSKHSLFPRIWAVEAVGIGAKRREFLTPCSITSFFKTSHSQRSEGLTPHISNWKIPSEIGDPFQVS